MKKTFFGIMLILASIGMLTAVFSAGFVSSALGVHEASLIPSTMVFLTPYRIYGTAGQTVTVYANITDVTGLLAYQIGLIWSNTTVVECTYVAGGSILNSIAGNSVEVPGTINNTLGKITSPYAWSGLGSEHNMNGSGTLAVFTFKMLQTGYADVHVNDMILIYKDGATIIPCNTVDYFTAVRSGKQYIVRIEGNPVEILSFYGGFGAESVTELSPPELTGITYQGNMTFDINGTADGVGPFAYFNATIPNNLMSCTSKDNWIVELGGVLQSGMLVSSGAQNTTISLAFSYFNSSSGKLTQTIEILSNYIAAGATYTIHIQADGSINPSTAPISTGDNITYTFNGDIKYPTYLGIVVERNNIVVNGNGHTVQGDTMYDNSDGLNLTNLSNVTIENINVNSFHWGIQLFNCSNCHVSRNSASGDLVGIEVGFSTYITVSGNNATANGFVGIEVGDYSNNNIIIANNAVQNGFGPSIPVEGGIFVDVYSNNNTVKENNIISNLDGMYLGGATNTKIYHNNFEYNTAQVYRGSGGNGSATVWNDPYPYGGNYWSDYRTKYPNATEVDSSGLWNTPYFIGANDKDYYPLMNRWLLLSVTIWPSAATLDIGQSQTCTSNVSGGLSPYTYQWYLDGAAVSGATSSTWIYTPPETGSRTIFVKITDNIGTQATSDTATVKVNEALSVTVSPATATLDVGQSEAFTSTVSGGTSPYSYQWYLNAIAVSGATNSTWTCRSTSTGSYTVYLEVADSAVPTANSVASNTATVTVNVAPSVTVSPGSTTMDVGQSKTFTLTATGGTSPFTCQWYLNGVSVSGATPISWTLTPTSSGSYTVYVNATDSVGIQAKSNVASVAVNPTLSVTISPTSVTSDVGQSRIFTVAVSGGTSPYSYHWYLDGSLISGVTGSVWTYSPSLHGSHTVYVSVTDDVGTIANSNTANATVNAALSVSITPASFTSDLGQSQTFVSTVSGGTSPYSYQWYLNGSLVLGPTSSWTFTPSLSSYTIYVNVTDGAEARAMSNTASVAVNRALAVSISPSLATLDVGQSRTFNSTVEGGTLLYSYQWYLNGSAVSGAVGSSWTFMPSSSALYTVYVKVTDGANVVATSNTAPVTVNAALPVAVIIAVIILVVVAVVVTVSLAMLIKRKRARNPHQP